MFDVQGDEHFDLVLTSGNDVASVTDLDAEEQALRLGVVAYFDAIIGEVDRPTVLKKLEVQATRLANALGFLGNLAAIRVAYDETRPDTAVVELLYTNGETTAFSLN